MEMFMEQLFSCQTPEDIYYYYSNYKDKLECDVDYNETEFQQELKDLISGLNDLYYNEGESPLSDINYDKLCEYIYNDFPDIKEHFEHKVGHNVESGSSVKLPFYMGSMNKIKTEKEINIWTKKYHSSMVFDPIKYVFSAKLDGISALYCANVLYSRGNGIMGQNISYLIPYLFSNELVEYLNEHNIILRGELIIAKQIFETHYKDEFSNARNLVCGIVNRNYHEDYQNFYKHIDFVVYDIYDNSKCPREKFVLMKKLEQLFNEFKCVSFYAHNMAINISLCNNLLQKWKNNYDYEIDGIICTHNQVYKLVQGENPKYSVAYKNNDLCVSLASGIVEKVIWNISKDNYIKPKIKFVEPVMCDNSKVSFVTGFNAKYIVENKICPGAKLEIGLSGNVIPHIFKVLEQGNYDDENELYPNADIIGSSFKWSKNKVDLICVSTDNVASTIKRNMMFFKNMNMKCGLQETTLVNLYNDKGIYRLHDILGLKMDSWISVNKIGEKKAQSFMNCFKETLHWENVVQNELSINPTLNIHNFKYEYLLKLSNASQCFGRGFAIKKIMAHYECLAEIYKIHNDIFELCNFYNADYIITNKDFILKQIRNKKYKSVTEDSMTMFLDGCVLLNAFIYNLNQNPNIIELNIHFVSAKILYSCFNLHHKQSQNQKQNINIKNENIKHFVFSGFRSKDIQNKLCTQGHVVDDNINKKTNYLVVQDKTKMTSKMKKALNMNIDILNPQELIDLQLF